MVFTADITRVENTGLLEVSIPFVFPKEPTRAALYSLWVLRVECRENFSSCTSGRVSSLLSYVHSPSRPSFEIEEVRMPLQVIHLISSFSVSHAVCVV